MLPKLLSGIITYPLLGTLLNAIYYSLIIIAMMVSLILAFRQLLLLGYDKIRVKRLIITFMIIIFPAAMISGRAANMFYYPSSYWSIGFFFEQIIAGRFITYHATLILPTILFVALIIAMRFRLLEVVDTLIMYIPLGHAIGRIGCLLVGCCWGNRITLTLLGNTYTFQNPIPLYAIILNLGIFFILRKTFNWIYHSGNREYSGLIIPLYLILYGNVRLLLEIFRTELVVYRGLTQAQIVMIFFIILGALIFIALMFRSTIRRDGTDQKSPMQHKEHYLAITGFAVYGIIFALLAFTLLNKGIVHWPFHRMRTITEAYRAILEYAPFAVIATLSIFWLKIAGLSLSESFRWKKLSPSFYVGIAVSLGYSVYLLMHVRFGLDSRAFWPPVIILSGFNALAEEILFRLVLFTLLRKIMNVHLANGIQSLAYAPLHLFIGGPVFAMLAFAYGMLLGYIREKNASVVPCIICHFLIDLGAIGAPLLSL
jgi:phosphatidylglycerol:prolipoprotein diacylglycerol transferase